MNESIFKAYDIRGRYPEEINETTVKRIAQAYAKYTGAKTVAVGRDVRLSGPSLQKAVIEGLVASGVTVIDIGVVPTELLYFAVGYYHYDGGIQVSASHNPAEYNGLKMIKAGVEAVSADNGLPEIKSLTTSDDDLSAEQPGQVHQKDCTEDFLDFLSRFAEFDAIKPTKIVFNANFGMSGIIVEQLFKRLAASAITLEKLNFEPDGAFPKGRPDPMVQENRAETSEVIQRTGADLAIAWDADGDRCYLADEHGVFVEGCHLTALLAEELLRDHPGEKVLYDPRNIWAQEATITASGGVPLMNKAGHTFIKNRMRAENALFAGEMSGHFYYRDFYYADSGLLTCIYLLNYIARAQKPVSQIVAPLRERFFVSGESNFTVESAKEVLDALQEKYSDGTLDTTDGISISYDDWRFNVRASNTEPLLRLNVEAKSQALCDQKTKELRSAIAQ